MRSVMRESGRRSREGGGKGGGRGRSKGKGGCGVVLREEWRVC